MLDLNGFVPRSFQVLRFGFLVSCLWIPKDSSKSLRVPLFYRICEILSVISYIKLTHSFLLKVIQYSASEKDFIILVIHVSVLLAIINSELRFCWLVLRRQNLIKIIFKLRQVLNRPEFSDIQMIKLRQAAKICIFYLVLPIILNTLAVIGQGFATYKIFSMANSLNSTSDNRTLTKGEINFVSQIKYYQTKMSTESLLTVSLVNLMENLSTVFTTATNAFYLTILVLLSGQLRLLKDSLGSALRLEIAGRHFKFYPGSLSHALISEAGVRNFKFISGTKRIEFVGFGLRQGTANRDPNFSKTTAKYFALKTWIRCLHDLIKLVEELNSLWSPIVVASFAESTCSMCFSAFAAAKSTGLPFVCSTFIVLNMLALLPLFLYCYAGYLLKQAGEGVSEAAHRGPWLGAPPDLVSGLQLLALDCRRSFVARGGPFFTLSLEFFASVVGAVLTYFIVLLQMKPAP